MGNEPGQQMIRPGKRIGCCGKNIYIYIDRYIHIGREVSFHIGVPANRPDLDPPGRRGPSRRRDAMKLEMVGDNP